METGRPGTPTSILSKGLHPSLNCPFHENRAGSRLPMFSVASYRDAMSSDPRATATGITPVIGASGALAAALAGCSASALVATAGSVGAAGERAASHAIEVTIARTPTKTNMDRNRYVCMAASPGMREQRAAAHA